MVNNMEQELTDLTKDLLGISNPFIFSIHNLSDKRQIIIEKIYQILVKVNINWKFIISNLKKDYYEEEDYCYIELTIDGYTEKEFIKKFIPMKDCTQYPVFYFYIRDFQMCWNPEQDIFRRILIDGE